jgi:tripartite ATP-independent transporter DctM subunit
MSIELITLVMFGGMVVLMLCGVPLGVATGSIAAVFTIGFYGFENVTLLTNRINSFIDSYVLISLPFFVFMASVMEQSGIATDLYNAMSVWAGKLHGGVAAMTTGVGMMMAVMSGVIGGEIVLLGLIALPQMLRMGYNRKLAIGTICAGGSLGTMIPPSITLIVYGLMVSKSISDLFLAAFIPGTIMGLSYITYILIRAYLNPALAPIASAEERNISLLEKIKLLKGVILPILIAFSVLGAIYGGITSVTEAAGIGAAAMIGAAWIRGKITWAIIVAASKQTIRTSAMVLWLIFGAVAFIGIYNLLGGGDFVQHVMAAIPVSSFMIIVIMCVIFVILGCFMDHTSICLLTIPLFAPIVEKLGYDLIWFGIIFSITCQTGYLSPPFGTAAFYLKGVAPKDISLDEIFRSNFPFVGMQLLNLAFFLCFPKIVLWPLTLFSH